LPQAEAERRELAKRSAPLAARLGGLIALSLAAACGTDSGSQVRLDFWAMGREGEVVARLLPAFERRHPAIRVRVQQVPWAAAHEKLLTAYAGDVMPDVVQLGTTWIAELVALRALERLDDRIGASRTLAGADYFPGILAANAIDGLTYAVPWYVDTRILFYRTDNLAAAGYAEPPHTWDGWLDALARVKERAGPAGYALLLPPTEWEPPVILALQRGAELLRDGDRYGNFRSAPVRDAFRFYLDLFQRRLAPAGGEARVANLYQEFARGYFSAYITGPWNIGEFSRRLPGAMQHAWSTAPMPTADDTWPGVSIAGGASLAIVRSSRRKDAAWHLIEYLSEPEQQVAFYRLTGDLPSRTTAWREAALTTDRYAGAFWRQLQAVVPTPKIPEWEQIAAKVAYYAERASRGAMTADEAVTALDRDVDALLEKRRWLLQQRRR
jgi:multiple sugar transport system substrate-binding protein